MKNLVLITLALFQFSSYSIEAFIKQTQSQVHANVAESVAVFSGGDFSLTIFHEDPETGHGCTFEGEKIAEDLYRDQSEKGCKVKVINRDTILDIQVANNANCSSVCGASAELNISGLALEQRE